MSTNKTSNYGLHAWEGGDDFLRSEFNENFAKLDTELARVEKLDGEKAELAIGFYTGKGGDMTVELGFTPKAVLVVNKEGKMCINNMVCGGLMLPGHPIYSTGSGLAAEIVEGGFALYSTSAYVSMSSPNENYYYIAVK